MPAAARWRGGLTTCSMIPISRPLISVPDREFQERNMSKAETSILISGAASGIGRATALCLAKDGVALTLFDRNTSAMAEVAGACHSQGAAVVAVAGDASSDADVAAAVGGAVNAYGFLSSVIAAAGVARKGDVTT